jgi:hypothetical protein
MLQKTQDSHFIRQTPFMASCRNQTRGVGEQLSGPN